ncbi:GyrI-like domain-containing protein [Brevundimonas goettingensis]|uniref:GyrI-like domain-containing protein n=1 Tax=Brevundimonas goettingensis TaxID=2774190 RepID=A0A975GUG5_9CAUL|nr:GyrI-like domain-containing protein [Brevundimonas goettingensis]QTC90026.1 GyrI-like domain-containing protein [Brevundimonas goettingensis]
MTPSRFETGRPMLLAGLRRWYAFSEGPTQIPLDWKAFVTRLPLPRQVGGRTYGATCQADMEGQRFEYMCAAEVETFDGLPDDLGRMTVPEAHYAVFVHAAPIWTIRDTITAGFAWLASNGEWKDAGTPNFERYGPGFDAKTGMGDTELWFPVTRP